MTSKNDRKANWCQARGCEKSPDAHDLKLRGWEFLQNISIPTTAPDVDCEGLERCLDRARALNPSSAMGHFADTRR
jgi:hypothetical protein